MYDYCVSLILGTLTMKMKNGSGRAWYTSLNRN